MFNNPPLVPDQKRCSALDHNLRPTFFKLSPDLSQPHNLGRRANMEHIDEAVHSVPSPLPPIALSQPSHPPPQDPIPHLLVI